MSELTSTSKRILNSALKGKLEGNSTSLAQNKGGNTLFCGKAAAGLQGVDCSDVKNVSSLTPIDLANSGIYAQNRILHDKCLALKASGKADVDWEPIMQDGSVPYCCPEALGDTCFYGHCAITSEQECMKYSQLPYDSEGNILPDANKNFYMEWKPKIGGKDGQMACYLGNYTFRRWCEMPKFRDPKDPDNDPRDAFKYTQNGSEGGTCELTEAYCSHKNMEWHDDSKTCYTSGTKQFAELLFGNTFDAALSGNCIVSDKRLKDKMVKLADNYGGKGVHLYFYTYSPEALELYPNLKEMQIGFLADEVETLFPELVVVKDGYKHIAFRDAQLKEKKYWRLINTLNNEHLLMRLLLGRFILEPKADSLENVRK